MKLFGLFSNLISTADFERPISLFFYCIFIWEEVAKSFLTNHHCLYILCVSFILPNSKIKFVLNFFLIFCLWNKYWTTCMQDGLFGGLHSHVKSCLLKKSSELSHWSFLYSCTSQYICVYIPNFSIIFCQALIKFQLESSTELTKRQISKVVMAIGSGEEGW